MASRRPATGHLAALLIAAMAAGTVLPALIGALGPLIIEDLGLSRSQLGSLVTLLSAAAMVLSPFAGRIVDRTESRTVAIILLVLCAGAWLAVSVGPTFAWLAVAAALGGFPQALSNPITNRLLWAHSPMHRRGTLFGVKQSGVQFGVAAASLVPFVAAVWGWRSALQLIVLAPVLALPWFRWVLPIDPPATRPVDGSKPTRTARGKAIVAWMTAYAVLMGAGIAAMVTYLPLFAFDELGVSAARAGLPAGLFGLMGGLSRIAWGVASDRLTRISWTLVVVAGGAAVGSVLVLLSTTLGVAWLWAGAVLAGLMAPAWNALSMFEVAKTVGKEQLGWASGVVFSGFFAGFTIAPISLGWLLDQTESYRLGWTIVAAGFGVAAVIAFGWHRIARRLPVASTVRGKDGTEPGKSVET